MEIKKKYISSILLTIAAYNRETQEPIQGLLFENIGLGAKRKLQKISKWLLAEHTQLIADHAEAAKSENPTEEINRLMEETVKSDVEPVALSEIEKIQTNKNYDFEIIEMFAQ